MPLLAKEPDIYPANLLETSVATEKPWWAMYTLARQEKKLMRLLAKTDVPFYAPVIPGDIVRPQAASAPVTSRYLRTMCSSADDEVARHSAVCTGCVSRWMPVGQPAELVEDLRQLHSLITMERPAFT